MATGRFMQAPGGASAQDTPQLLAALEADIRKLAVYAGDGTMRPVLDTGLTQTRAKITAFLQSKPNDADASAKLQPISDKIASLIGSAAVSAGDIRGVADMCKEAALPPVMKEGPTNKDSPSLGSSLTDKQRSALKSIESRFFQNVSSLNVMPGLDNFNTMYTLRANMLGALSDFTSQADKLHADPNAALGMFQADLDDYAHKTGMHPDMWNYFFKNLFVSSDGSGALSLNIDGFKAKFLALQDAIMDLHSFDAQARDLMFEPTHDSHNAFSGISGKDQWRSNVDAVLGTPYKDKFASPAMTILLTRLYGPDGEGLRTAGMTSEHGNVADVYFKAIKETVADDGKRRDFVGRLQTLLSAYPQAAKLAITAVTPQLDPATSPLLTVKTEVRNELAADGRLATPDSPIQHYYFDVVGLSKLSDYMTTVQVLDDASATQFVTSLGLMQPKTQYLALTHPEIGERIVKEFETSSQSLYALNNMLTLQNNAFLGSPWGSEYYREVDYYSWLRENLTGTTLQNTMSPISRNRTIALQPKLVPRVSPFSIAGSIPLPFFPLNISPGPTAPIGKQVLVRYPPPYDVRTYRITTDVDNTFNSIDLWNRLGTRAPALMHPSFGPEDLTKRTGEMNIYGAMLDAYNRAMYKGGMDKRIIGGGAGGILSNLTPFKGGEQTSLGGGLLQRGGGAQASTYYTSDSNTPDARERFALSQSETALIDESSNNFAVRSNALVNSTVHSLENTSSSTPLGWRNLDRDRSAAINSVIAPNMNFIVEAVEQESSQKENILKINTAQVHDILVQNGLSETAANGILGLFTNGRAKQQDVFTPLYAAFLSLAPTDDTAAYKKAQAVMGAIANASGTTVTEQTLGAGTAGHKDATHYYDVHVLARRGNGEWAERYMTRDEAKEFQTNMNSVTGKNDQSFGDFLTHDFTKIRTTFGGVATGRLEAEGGYEVLRQNMDLTKRRLPQGETTTAFQGQRTGFYIGAHVPADVLGRMFGSDKTVDIAAATAKTMGKKGKQGEADLGTVELAKSVVLTGGYLKFDANQLFAGSNQQFRLNWQDPSEQARMARGAYFEGLWINHVRTAVFAGEGSLAGEASGNAAAASLYTKNATIGTFMTWQPGGKIQQAVVNGGTGFKVMNWRMDAIAGTFQQPNQTQAYAVAAGARPTGDKKPLGIQDIVMYSTYNPNVTSNLIAQRRLSGIGLQLKDISTSLGNDQLTNRQLTDAYGNLWSAAANLELYTPTSEFTQYANATHIITARGKDADVAALFSKYDTQNGDMFAAGVFDYGHENSLMYFTAGGLIEGRNETAAMRQAREGSVTRMLGVGGRLNDYQAMVHFYRLGTDKPEQWLGHTMASRSDGKSEVAASAMAGLDFSRSMSWKRATRMYRMDLAARYKRDDDMKTSLIIGVSGLDNLKTKGVSVEDERAILGVTMDLGMRFIYLTTQNPGTNSYKIETEVSVPLSKDRRALLTGTYSLERLIGDTRFGDKARSNPYMGIGVQINP